MTRLLLLGAGKIGSTITAMLGTTGDYEITVADSDAKMLALIPEDEAATVAADLADAKTLLSLAEGKEVVVSALPYYLNVAVAEAARTAGAHYFDLTEDVETTEAVKRIAKGAETAFVPQCGLAPGFVSIVAYDLARKFEILRDVHMRVGALPQYPVNALKYNLTWSTDGLINEYCNPCDAVHDGARIKVLALEGLEQFSLDGVRYEAFNTSGGLGTLAETLEGKVDSLNYKTVRYPGHCEMIKMLVRDLRLSERRALFRDLLDTAVPMTKQDVVLIFVTVAGMQEKRLTQESYAKKIYNSEIDGREWSAIQVTTAAGLCAMVDLLVAGTLPQKGFVKQEQCRLDDFLANRFGQHYA
jgi:saccharopine dehydrogenase-like NADP-dependent oxidoreductase